MPSPTKKHCKLYIKDASGEIIQMLPRTTIPEYQGATGSASGTAGTVPPASSAEKDNFLKGDGTWGEIEKADAAGEFETAQTVALTEPETPVPEPDEPENLEVPDYPELTPELPRRPAVKEEPKTKTTGKKTVTPASPETVRSGSRVKTGDDTNIALYLIPAVLAALALALLFAEKRRAGKNESKD